MTGRARSLCLGREIYQHEMTDDQLRELVAVFLTIQADVQ